MAAHTRSGVHGMSMCVTPRCDTASTTAFWIAGVEPMVPDSPMPFAPSGFRGLSVCVFDASPADVNDKEKKVQARRKKKA